MASAGFSRLVFSHYLGMPYIIVKRSAGKKPYQPEIDERDEYSHNDFDCPKNNFGCLFLLKGKAVELL